jgi:hypothetical protein
MIFTESIESEKLKELILGKKKYLTKTQGANSQFVKKEILFLERDILPAVQAGTDLLYHEGAKYFIRALDLAMSLKYNGLIVYIPIHDEYTENPVIGVANPKCESLFGDPGHIEIEVINMDNCGVPVRPVNIPLDGFL